MDRFCMDGRDVIFPVGIRDSTTIHIAVFGIHAKE
jgi:hypothetical protein